MTTANPPLADLRQVHIDTRKPIEERTRDLIDALGTPYRYQVGDITVRLCFNPKGKTLADALIHLMHA